MLGDETQDGRVQRDAVGAGVNRYFPCSICGEEKILHEKGSICPDGIVETLVHKRPPSKKSALYAVSQRRIWAWKALRNSCVRRARKTGFRDPMKVMLDLRCPLCHKKTIKLIYGSAENLPMMNRWRCTATKPCGNCGGSGKFGDTPEERVALTLMGKADCSLCHATGKDSTCDWELMYETVQ